MSAHTDLCNLLLREVQAAFKNDVRVFKRSIGMAFTNTGTPVRFGITGQCDIWGYLKARPRAIPFEIEVKVGRDTVREGQRAWHCLLESMGVPLLVLHASSRTDFKRACADAVNWLRGLQ